MWKKIDGDLEVLVAGVAGAVKAASLKCDQIDLQLQFHSDLNQMPNQKFLRFCWCWNLCWRKRRWNFVTVENSIFTIWWHIGIIFHAKDGVNYLAACRSTSGLCSFGSIASSSHACCAFRVSTLIWALISHRVVASSIMTTIRRACSRPVSCIYK